MKYFKLMLIINLAISLVVIVMGFFNSSIKQPFQDIKVINNHGLILDTVNVKSVRYNINPNNNDSTYEESFEFSLTLINDGKEKNILYNQNLYDLENNLIENGEAKRIEVLRNNINNNLFLNDSKYLAKIQRSNYLKIYFYISGILILIFFSIIILKKHVKK